MQFVVPQFIDVENKILGPISVRQFIIFIIAAFGIFLELKLFTLVVAIIMAVITFAVAGSLAFLKINGRPFHYFLLSLLQGIKEPRLKVWSKEPVPGELKHERTKVKKKIVEAAPKHVTLSRLAELSLVVDTGGAYREEGGEAIETESLKV